MHKPTWKVPEVALSFLQDNTPGNKLRLTRQTKMQKQQPHAHTQIWKRSEEIDNMWIRMNTTEYRWTYMNSLDCIRWYKHAETLVIKSKQRPNHFYFMKCTCAVWEQTWTNQRRSNMSSSDPFKLGRLFSWVPGRVWRTKSRLGSQSIVAFNLVRKMRLARSSSWKGGQTWRRTNQLCQVPRRQHGKMKDWKAAATTW